MMLAHSWKYAWRRRYLHIWYFSSCLPKSFSSSSRNQTRTQPPTSGIHLANLICFYMSNNHFVVQNVSKKDQSEGCFLDVLLLTFSGHSSCPSAVYPGCVYREGWRVSTCSPSPAGMQSKGELEGEKGHTCRALKPPQVLKEEQRSEMSRSR